MTRRRVAIIGAGMAGASLAAEIAAQDDVVLIEATSALAKRRYHRQKLHLILSALRHAERDPAGAVGLDHRRHRNQCKGIRCAVAHLAVHVAPAHRGRQGDRGDQLAGVEHVLLVRRGAGQQVEVGDRDAAGAAVGAHRVHLRVEHAHRHLEAFVLGAEPVRLGDDHVVEDHVGDLRAAAHSLGALRDTAQRVVANLPDLLRWTHGCFPLRAW